MRFAALILGLFAGLGHIVLGQTLKGAIFGSLFIICLNSLLLGRLVLMGTIAATVFWSGVGCTIAVWGIAYRDLVLSVRAARGQNRGSPGIGRKQRSSGEQAGGATPGSEVKAARKNAGN